MKFDIKWCIIIAIYEIPIIQRDSIKTLGGSVMQYEITKENDILTVKTQARLNLEPKDWRKDLKADLITALRSTSSNDQYLKAELRTNETEFFDVENVLFYNVGTSNFKGMDSKGVWFQLNKSDDQMDYKYIHQYSLIESIEKCRENIIAEWSDIIIDKPSTTKKPLDYWIALKSSDNIRMNTSLYADEFGLYIEIYKPEQEKINVVNCQKALLDGIISAFHKMSYVDAFVIEYFALHTGKTFDYISNIIHKNESCLSERDVIQQYRSGIKWNPQDEKCIDVRIVVKDTNEEKYRMSGYIFKK